MDTGRVHDVIAAARRLRETHRNVPLLVGGTGGAGILAAYAALWEPEIAEVLVDRPPATHMDPAAPQFLNVLRVGDIPDLLGLLASRTLTVISDEKAFGKVSAIYAAADAAGRVTIAPSRRSP